MYKIEITKTARNFLRKIEKKDSELIIKKIYSIRGNPFRFLKRLEGEKLWRLRIKKYRAIVDVLVSANRLVVLRIGLRKNIYN